MKGCLPKILAAVLSLPLVVGVAWLLGFTLPRLGALPEGEELRRLQASPHYRNGRFHNVAEHCGLPVPQKMLKQAQGDGYKSFPRLLWETFIGSGARGLVPERPLPVLQTDLDALPRERDGIVWFGHSSYLVQLAGKRILVDPVFGTASPIPGINRPFPGTEDYYSPERMPAVDVLLITHDHYDHLDSAAGRALPARGGLVICPRGGGAHFRRGGYAPERIRELDWGERVELPGLRVNAHTAYHYSGRLYDTHSRVLWASYVLQGNGRTLYLSGDSGYATHFAAIGRQYGHIDYAVMENGQYNPRWRRNHMLPHELPHAIRDLRARRVLTVHHSKYRLAPHPYLEPLENALELSEGGFAVDLPWMGQPVWFDEPPNPCTPPTYGIYWWRLE